MDFTQFTELAKNLGVITCLIFGIWYLYTERNKEKDTHKRKEERREERERELIEKILNSKYETQDYKNVIIKTLQAVGGILQVLDKSVLMQNEKDEELIANIETLTGNLKELVKKIGES